MLLPSDRKDGIDTSKGCMIQRDISAIMWHTSSSNWERTWWALRSNFTGCRVHWTPDMNWKYSTHFFSIACRRFSGRSADAMLPPVVLTENTTQLISLQRWARAFFSWFFQSETAKMSVKAASSDICTLKWVRRLLLLDVAYCNKCSLCTNAFGGSGYISFYIFN